MRYRRLGKTGLQVSEIGFGGEWLERHPEAEGIELIHHAAAQGINILDCWMADPGHHRQRHPGQPQPLVYPGPYRLHLEGRSIFPKPRHTIRAPGV